MSEPSCREQIEQIASGMRHDPSPAEIRGYEVALAGLFWRASKEATLCKIDFKRAINEADGASESARKRIAEGSEAFGRWLEAENTVEACKQMLVTCRSSLRSVSDEMRLQR